MDSIPILMFFIYGGFFLVSFVIIIYLIVQRIKTKGKEDFEQRDN